MNLPINNALNESGYKKIPRPRVFHLVELMSVHLYAPTLTKLDDPIKTSTSWHLLSNKFLVKTS